MSRIIDVAIERLSDSCCSEYELRQYLVEEFNASPDLNSKINLVINQLKEQHLINDLRLAMNLAQRYAHKGNCFIAQILSQRGIADASINQVLLSLDNENVRALDEARKKLGGQWDSSEKTMNLLHRFLSGRKFSYAVITTVISQLGDQRRFTVHEY